MPSKTSPEPSTLISDHTAARSDSVAGREPDVAAGPIAVASRYESLDVLRGFALLGILLMNIQSFSMPGAAYMNPTAYGDFQGWNRVVWYALALLADTKFMTLFSLLFGGGMVVMSDRLRSRSVSPWGIHYRRMVGLLVIGLIHAYVFWVGDILVPYAICGALTFPLIRWRARYLLMIAAALLAIRILVDVGLNWSMPYWGDEALTEMRETEWEPSQQALEAELSAYRGGWWEQSAYRVPDAFIMQVFALPLMLFWRIAGLMLAGAALVKLGVLTGRRSRRVYAWMIAVGMPIGLCVIAWGIWRNESKGWPMTYSCFLGQVPNFVGSLFVAAGYVGAVEWIRRGSWGSLLTRILAPVGRTALSNYLFQTLVCTTLFFGHGFGWFGRVSRVEQFFIVLAIWVTQILLSIAWCHRYRFGPAEYVWRLMTYGKPFTQGEKRLGKVSAT